MFGLMGFVAGQAIAATDGIVRDLDGYSIVTGHTQRLGGLRDGEVLVLASMRIVAVGAGAKREWLMLKRGLFLRSVAGDASARIGFSGLELVLLG
jgi:sugar diacid utilization regulator